MGQLERRAEVISGGASTFTILQTGLGRRWPMHVQKYFDKLRGVDDHIYKTVRTVLTRDPVSVELNPDCDTSKDALLFTNVQKMAASVCKFESRELGFKKGGVCFPNLIAKLLCFRPIDIYTNLSCNIANANVLEIGYTLVDRV